MDEVELDNLIEAFLRPDEGGLSAAESERLAALLETDEKARRAFDEALKIEALLRAAHNDRSVEMFAENRLKAHLKNVSKSVAKKSLKVVRITQPEKRFSARAWMAVAAMVALMFSIALYNIYAPGVKVAKPAIAENPAKQEVVFAVSSGRAWVDGGESRDVAAGQWLNVSPDGPAHLQAPSGVKIDLDSGSGAVLRKSGATLLNGTATFEVPNSAKSFAIETASGRISTAGGQILVRMVPNLEANAATENVPDLIVTVLSGMAQVDTVGNSRVLKQGERLALSNNKILDEPTIKATANKSEEKTSKPPRPPAIGPKPSRDCASRDFAEIILHHASELRISPEQSGQLKKFLSELEARRKICDNDPKFNELDAKIRQAHDNWDERLAFELEKEQTQRMAELSKDASPLAQPIEILAHDQREQLREIMERNHLKNILGQGLGHPPPLPPQPAPGLRPENEGWMIENFAKELGISDEQRTRLEAFRESRRAYDADEELMRLNEQLFRAPNPEAAASIRSKIKTRMKVLGVADDGQSPRSPIDILTEEQRKKLEILVERDKPQPPPHHPNPLAPFGPPPGGGPPPPRANFN